MHRRLTPLALWIMLAACGSDGGGAGVDAGPGDDARAGGDGGSVETDGGADAAIDVDAAPGSAARQWVVDQVLVPETGAEATLYGLDIDGDALMRPDNALGQVIATLASFSTTSVQDTADDAVLGGEVIHLLQLDAVDLSDDPAATLWVFIGNDPSPLPCTDPGDPATCGQHLDGSGSFGIAADAPTDTAMPAVLATGALRAGPGEITVEVPVFVGAGPVRLPLIGARAELDGVDASGVNGKIGGAVTEDAVNDEVIPAIAAQMGDIIAQDCSGSSPTCCDAGSLGETITDLFDEDMDCQVTADELRQNSLVSSLLAPDVDLLDANGDFNPNTDGVNDSLSIGVGITAVSATFPAQ